MIDRRRRKSEADAGDEPALDPRTRALIEEIIRELEFEGPVRWKPAIDRLRRLL